MHWYNRYICISTIFWIEESISFWGHVTTNLQWEKKADVNSWNQLNKKVESDFHKKKKEFIDLLFLFESVRRCYFKYLYKNIFCIQIKAKIDFLWLRRFRLRTYRPAFYTRYRRKWMRALKKTLCDTQYSIINFASYRLLLLN